MKNNIEDVGNISDKRNSLKILKNETCKEEIIMIQVRIRINSICLLFTIGRDLWSTSILLSFAK